MIRRGRHPEVSDLFSRGSGRAVPGTLRVGRQASPPMPALGSVRGLTARMIVAELWLGIGLVALIATLGEREFGPAIALSTICALLPSLVWVCDPASVVSRCLLSGGLVAQCVLLSLLGLETFGAVTYGVFAFSLVLLAQVAGFICWRSLVLAGGLLISCLVAAGFWFSSSGGGGFVFADSTLVSELLDVLLPLWLLILVVLLPMTYRVERALGEAHASRLAALEAMTLAVEESRSAANGPSPQVGHVDVPGNPERVPPTGQLEGSDDAGALHYRLASPGRRELTRRVAGGQGELHAQEAGALIASALRKSSGLDRSQVDPDNPVHLQQRTLARALESLDTL